MLAFYIAGALDKCVREVKIYCHVRKTVLYIMNSSNTTSSNISDLLNSVLIDKGFEVHFFKLQWYNQIVSPPFVLDHDENSLCAVILTLPAFFEKALLPFLAKKFDNGKNQPQQVVTKDAVDQCISHHMEQCRSLLQDSLGLKCEIMYDYEMHPNRRPKVLVQTAAHVSGAAFYYQRKHAEECCGAIEKSTLSSPLQNTESPWPENKKIFGVCIHPNYGGWFAIRSVIVFTNHTDLTLNQLLPVDCVSSKADRVKLLSQFNGNWQNWKFRDIIQVKEKYSDLQMKYFSTLPRRRGDLLKEMIAYYFDINNYECS